MNESSTYHKLTKNKFEFCSDFFEKYYESKGHTFFISKQSNNFMGFLDFISKKPEIKKPEIKKPEIQYFDEGIIFFNSGSRSDKFLNTAKASRSNDIFARSNSMADRIQKCTALCDYTEAVNSFDKAIAIKPDYFEAWYYRGLALLKLRSGADLPDNLEFEVNGKKVMLVKRKWDSEAIDSFDKVVAIHADYAEASKYRGLALYNLGRYSEAINSFGKASLDYPNDSQVWNWFGDALVMLSQYLEAIDSYDRAIAINPKYAEAWSNRGVALGHLGRYSEAVASYSKTLAINQNDADSWNNLGIALLKLDKNLDALASFNNAIKIDQNCANAWFCRGNVLCLLGQYTEAVVSYDRAIAINPNDVEAKRNREIALKITQKK